MHFPAGVVHDEGEWSRCSHSHKVRCKSEVFCRDGHGLHRPVTRKEGGEQQTDERDPAGERQDPTELTRTHTPASIQESSRPFKWLSQSLIDCQQGVGSAYY